jgi:hypothetical protein
LIGSTPEATVFQFAFCLLLYNTLQVTRGFIAANQKRPAESISIENIFVDVTEELLTFDVLLRRGLVWLDAIPPCEDVALRLRELLKQEWSDRWIKAINKKRPLMWFRAANEPTDRSSAFWKRTEKDVNSSGCQSPGNGPYPHGQHRSRIAPGTLPADRHRPLASQDRFAAFQRRASPQQARTGKDGQRPGFPPNSIEVLSIAAKKH